MAAYTLTAKFIEAKQAEQVAAKQAGEATRNLLFFADNRGAPAGFGVRISSGGTAAFFLNYTATDPDTGVRAERRLTIGRFGKSPLLSVAAAMKLAAEKRIAVTAGKDPLGDARRARAAAEAAKRAADARSKYTLQGLVDAYSADLERRGRVSHKEVEKLFKRTVADPFPKIAALPVDEVTPEKLLPAFRAMSRRGAKRDPEKLAAYLKAAFNTARKARKSVHSHDFDGFNVTGNPLIDLDASREEPTEAEAREFKAARRWVLTQPQLAAYWAAIRDMDTPRGAMLRLHLLTGAQRREQLVRLTRADHDAERGTVMLWDRKGRKGVPREHPLPLLPEAADAIKAMAGVTGPFLVSLDGGETAATTNQLDDAMEAVTRPLADDGALPRHLTPGALRRTVETLLSDANVSKDARAQLQSHGRGGVQDRHYDMSERLALKRAALESLRALCDPKPDNVTHLSSKRKKAGLT